MSALDLPFMPPAPKVHARDLPMALLLWKVANSTISHFPDYAFDILYARRGMLGLEAILVNDPEAARHILVANVANYRRPHAVNRVARPLGGSGLFLAEGADWRRQRRLLAPTFTPGSINVLLPHFHAAGIHLIHAIEKSAQANLSKAFQDAALEAVLRALL